MQYLNIRNFRLWSLRPPLLSPPSRWPLESIWIEPNERHLVVSGLDSGLYDKFSYGHTCSNFMYEWTPDQVSCGPGRSFLTMFRLKNLYYSNYILNKWAIWMIWTYEIMSYDHSIYILTSTSEINSISYSNY